MLEALEKLDASEALQALDKLDASEALEALESLEALQGAALSTAWPAWRGRRPAFMTVLEDRAGRLIDGSLLLSLDCTAQRCAGPTKAYHLWLPVADTPLSPWPCRGNCSSLRPVVVGAVRAERSGAMRSDDGLLTYRDMSRPQSAREAYLPRTAVVDTSLTPRRLCKFDTPLLPRHVDITAVLKCVAPQ